MGTLCSAFVIQERDAARDFLGKTNRSQRAPLGCYSGPQAAAPCLFSLLMCQVG